MVYAPTCHPVACQILFAWVEAWKGHQETSGISHAIVVVPIYESHRYPFHIFFTLAPRGGEILMAQSVSNLLKEFQRYLETFLSGKFSTASVPSGVLKPEGYPNQNLKPEVYYYFLPFQFLKQKMSFHMRGVRWSTPSNEITWPLTLYSTACWKGVAAFHMVTYLWTRYPCSSHFIFLVGDNI